MHLLCFTLWFKHSLIFCLLCLFSSLYTCNYAFAFITFNKNKISFLIVSEGKLLATTLQSSMLWEKKIYLQENGAADLYFPYWLGWLHRSIFDAFLYLQHCAMDWNWVKKKKYRLHLINNGDGHCGTCWFSKLCKWYSTSKQNYAALPALVTHLLHTLYCNKILKFAL